MFTRAGYRFLSVAIVLVALPTIAHAVIDPENMLVSWPPPALTIPRWKNSEPVDAEAANPEVPKKNIFSCSYYNVPPNVERTPFPINGAHLQINRTGTPWINTYAPVPHSIAGKWMLHVRAGQFQGIPGVPDDAYHVLDTFYFDMDEFKPGLNCTTPFERNVTDVQTGYREHVYPVNASQLEGLEMTLSFELAHFYPAAATNDSSAETLTVQCAYIRLTSGPVDSACKPRQDSGSSSTDKSSTTITPPGQLATGTGQPGPQPDTASDSSGSDTKEVSIIAGAATVGVAVPVIVIITFLCMRRRKRRLAEALPRVPAPVKEVKVKEKQLEKKRMVDDDRKILPITYDKKPTTASKSKKDGEDGQSSIHTDAGSSSSVYTEPLPRYEPAETGGR